MSSYVKLFKTEAYFFISEYTETIRRTGSALPQISSWLQGMGPPGKGKEKMGERKKERKGDRHDRHHQFLKRG